MAWALLKGCVTEETLSWIVSWYILRKCKDARMEGAILR